MRDLVKRSFDGMGDFSSLSSSHIIPALTGLGVDTVRPHGLPMFGVGEYIFGSMLEREFESTQLYATIFLLNRFALRKDRAEQINPVYRDLWANISSDADEDAYFDNGVRKGVNDYFCRLSHSSTSDPYYTKAVFVPNRLSHDTNENKVLEIARCKLTKSLDAYRQFGSTKESVYVELFKSSRIIANFSIPWYARKAGFMLDGAEGSSKVDEWAGYGDDVDSNSLRPIVTNLCVPGVFRLPQGKPLHVYLEFVSHHLLLGFQHIYLSVGFGMESDAMREFVRLFKPFIDEGRLSIVSASADNIDFSTTTTGLSWSRIMSKRLHVNMCLFAAKGVADYVAVLDADEYLILKDDKLSVVNDVISLVDVHPLHRLHSLSNVPLTIEMLQRHWKGGKGWADGDAHPLCFMQLSSEVLVDRQLDVGGNVHANPNNLTLYSSIGPGEFVGRRFVEGTIGPGQKAHNRYGYLKTIMPTRRIFQGSLVGGGACLMYNWPCSLSTGKSNASGMAAMACGDVKHPLQPLGVTSTGDSIDFRDYHSFYEVVRRMDGKAINATSIASIYHFKIFGNAGTGLDTPKKDGMSKAAYPKYSDNLYLSKYFPNVLQDLTRRGLIDIIASNSVGIINTTRIFNGAIPGWDKFDSARITPSSVSKVQVHPAPPLSPATPAIVLANKTVSIPEVGQAGVGGGNNSSNTKSVAAAPQPPPPVAPVVTNVSVAGVIARFPMNVQTEQQQLLLSQPTNRVDVPISTESRQPDDDIVMMEKFEIVNDTVADRDYYTELPNFVSDYSEFVLSSLIERSSDSYDLHVTIFMLCKDILDPVGKDSSTKEGALHVSAKYATSWKHTINSFLTAVSGTGRDSEYLANGDRNSYKRKYYCRITYDTNNSHLGLPRSVLVRGYFVPNRVTVDSNSNRRLDILRCKIPEEHSRRLCFHRQDERLRAYCDQHSSAHMKVELIRRHALSETSNGSMNSLITFLLPWATRTAGYLMQPIVTRLDPWKGLRRLPPLSAVAGSNSAVVEVNDDGWSEDPIYLIAPGIESVLSKKSIALYLEFIQHHLNVGVDHIFLSAAYSWPSGQNQTSSHSGDNNMDTLLRFLQPYIDEGKVSLTSMSDTSCDEPTDFVFVTRGLAWGKDNVMIFHVNAFTYFAKGMATYVGVWDLDEFFIPRLNSLPSKGRETSTIVEVIQHASATSTFGDGEGHPFCYLQLSSEVTYSSKAAQSPIDQPDKPFAGQLFAHGPENRSNLMVPKSIRPTRAVYYGGLHVVGACALPSPWSGCDDGADNNSSKTENGTHVVVYESNPEFCSVGSSTNFSRRATIRPDSGSTVAAPPATLDLHTDHFFDELVTDSDSRHIDARTEAVLSHVQPYRSSQGASLAALNTNGDYVGKHYFDNVLVGLKQRGLYVPVVLADYDLAEDSEQVLPAGQALGMPHEDAQSSHARLANVQLPAWSADYSELIFGSVLEQKTNSSKAISYTGIDVFSMSQSAIRAQIARINKAGLNNIDVRFRRMWERASAASNVMQTAGAASYSCIVSIVSPSDPVNSTFVVNTVDIVTSDAGGSGRVGGVNVDLESADVLNILRCRFDHSLSNAIAASVAGVVEPASVVLHVEVVRQTKAQSVTLLRFTLDMEARINCELIRSSKYHDTRQKSDHRNSNNNVAGVSFHHWNYREDAAKADYRGNVYLLAGDLETIPNRQTLPRILEFIEHHSRQGFKHIFVASPFDWDSEHTQNYGRIFKQYMDSNQLTLSTMSLPHCNYIDNAMDMHAPKYCMFGSRWSKHVLRTAVLNVWGYWLKGSDQNNYAAIWNTRRFFIPKQAAYQHAIGYMIHFLDQLDHTDHHSVPNLSKGHNSSSSDSASKSCLIHMYTRSIHTSISQAPTQQNPLMDPSIRYIRNYYNSHHGSGPTLPLSLLQQLHPQSVESHSEYASIVDVNAVYYFGQHVSGACVSSTAASSTHSRYEHAAVRTIHNARAIVFHFDDTLSPASLNHEAPASASGANNVYVEHFAAFSMEAIERKNLDLLFLLPYRKQTENLITDNWLTYAQVFASRNRTLL
jgi:hypothetical protein